MLPAPSGRPASAARHPPHRCTVFREEPCVGDAVPALLDPRCLHGLGGYRARGR